MSKKILVIESDGPFAQELSHAIEARGLEARIVGDGKEGLDLARVDRPDAIVLCVELPRMSGYSICNKLKKDDQLKSIPLVIMSAEATAETFEQHRKLKTRAEEYLIKPFSPGDLLKKIAGLVGLPPGQADDEEVVTLDDVEELEGLQDSAAHPPGEDDDLKLLDEAFESLAGDAPAPPAPALAVAPPLAQEDLAASSDVIALEPVESTSADAEIDRLGADADAALDALGADDGEEVDLASAAALLDVEEPGVAPAQLLEGPTRDAAPSGAAPEPASMAAAALTAEHADEVQRLEDRVSELLIEVSRVREALEQREAELAAARERAGELERAAEAHRAAAEETQERSRLAAEEQARSGEAAARAAEETLAAAREEARRAEERARALEEGLRQAGEAQAAEARARADAEAALAAAQAALAESKERLESADERVSTAEEVTRAAEARSAAAEAESAELTLKLEEAEQAASLRAAESAQARERAEAVARELEEARGRAEAHEGDLAGLRPRLEAAEALVAAARADGERGVAELKRRIAELESQTSKHEERVVKAYQKIKGDEKIREKTRKALAIALQLLEERAPGAAPAEVQPRRE